jgi:lipoate-protein ligase A
MLDTGIRHAAWNMAIDEALLEGADAAKTPILRFYQWENPTLSLGYFQSINDVNLTECERLKVDWIRRPTGGRAVLHDDELTYSVVGPIEHFATGVESSYEMLSEALIFGLQELGLQPELTRRDTNNSHKNPVCFAAPVYAELTIHGKKVIGSAQMRTKHTLLQHGSIPLTIDYEKLRKVFKVTSADGAMDMMKEKASGIADFLTRPLAMEQVKRAVRRGFERRFGTNFEPLAIGEALAERACELFVRKYSTQEWNHLR